MVSCMPGPATKPYERRRIKPRVCRYQNAYKRISSTHPRRDYFTIDICLKALAQKASVALVDLDEPGDRCIGVGKGLGCYSLRGQYGVHVVDQISANRPESMLLKFYGRCSGVEKGRYLSVNEDASQID